MLGDADGTTLPHKEEIYILSGTESHLYMDDLNIEISRELSVHSK
jgi:hypothetical protein